MARLPAAEKLPLAVRKDVRDNWENKKADAEKRLSDLLGQSWTIDINPLAIWPYGEDGSWAKTSTGDMLTAYVEGAEYQLKYLIDQLGEHAKAELNSICTAHTLTMDLDEASKFSYCGCEVSPSGQLVILFAAGNLGTNVNDALERSKLTQALDGAPGAPGPMNFSARTSIRVDYDAEIGPTQAKLDGIAQRPLALEPGFEAVYAKLQASREARDDWPTNLGGFVRRYWEGLVAYLEREKFGEDDMLREGLLDALDKETVRFRVVDKLKATYNECVIEEGVLYLQTTPANFGTNVDDAAIKLMDLL